MVHHNFLDVPCESQGLWMVLKLVSNEWSWHFFLKKNWDTSNYEILRDLRRHNEVPQIKKLESNWKNGQVACHASLLLVRDQNQQVLGKLP